MAMTAPARSGSWQKIAPSRYTDRQGAGQLQSEGHKNANSYGINLLHHAYSQNKISL